MTLHIKHSQNYMRDPLLISHILQKTSLTQSDTVVEIGAGLGVMTAVLSKLVSKVYAIEKSEQSIRELHKRFRSNSRVAIIQQDFMDYYLPTIPFKIVANIPYTVTADILKKILPDRHMTEAYLVLQREAAYKYIGQPHGVETLLSLYYKPIYEYSLMHSFKETDFNPVPKVSSIMMRIEKRGVPLVFERDMNLYKEFVTYGFNQHKPSLEKAFGNIFTVEQFARLAHDLSFSRNAKPTDLVFEQWLLLFEYFRDHVEEGKKRVVVGSVAKLSRVQSRLTKVHRTR